MNKSEAAEALYRAGLAWSDARANHRLTMLECVQLDAAIAAYSTATPDALPAEVQRVVEAAVKMAPVLGEALRDAYGDADYADDRRFCSADVEAIEEVAPDFIAAVDAYRSSQPESLSARLARLYEGGIVATDGPYSPYRVLANIASHKELACEYVAAGETRVALVPYGHVRAIIEGSFK